VDTEDAEARHRHVIGKFGAAIHILNDDPLGIIKVLSEMSLASW